MTPVGGRLSLLPTLSLLALALLPSCHASEKPAVRVHAAPTDAECVAFAKSFREALIKPNVARANVMIDWDAVVDKATANVEVNDQFRRGFIKGAKENAGKAAFAQKLSDVLAEGGNFDLLRIRDIKGEKHALLRLLLPDGGVNYHEMVLDKDESGIVRAADIYIYTSAETLSDTIRRMYILTAAEQPKNMLQSIVGSNKSEIIEHIGDFSAMAKAARDGKSEEVLRLYATLPAKLRAEKSSMLLYVQACSKISDEKYAAALEEFRKANPNEAGADLMSIDAFLLGKKYDEAMAAIGRVDAALGGDPYLDVLRANVLVAQGDRAAARVSAERAAQREPTLVDAQWSLIGIALAEANYDETLKLLHHVQDDLNVPVADLTTIPDYAGFVQSPQYREWIAKD